LTGQPVNGVTVKAAAYSRMTDAAGSYGNLVVVPGEYSITVSANGYQEQTIVLTAGPGQTVIRNFALEPIPVIAETTATISAESCGIDHAAEPGETVTVDLALHNT